MLFDFLFKKEDKYFKASKEEFDSIMVYAYVNAIEVCKEKLIEHLDRIHSGYSARMFLCIIELFHISRYCETISILSSQYQLKDEFEVAKMLDSTKDEALNLATEIYNNKVKDPISAINEEVKRIENRLNDFKEYCRLIAMSKTAK